MQIAQPPSANDQNYSYLNKCALNYDVRQYMCTEQNLDWNLVSFVLAIRLKYARAAAPSLYHLIAVLFFISALMTSEMV